MARLSRKLQLTLETVATRSSRQAATGPWSCCRGVSFTRETTQSVGDLGGDPGVGLLDADSQRLRWLPAQHLANQLVVGIAATNTEGTRDVPDPQALARDRHRHLGKVIDGHHLFRPDIEGSGLGGSHQTQRSLNAFVDIEERSRLLPAPPDLDLAATLRLRDFPANRGR